MIYTGNCLDIMPTLPADSVDSIVTDPPYGLSFMGKDWDHGVPGAQFWREALRVAKPGAFLLAFGGTRTFHRLAVAIEDAGWEMRDTVMWVYGSGFPKSLDVGKAIDKVRAEDRPAVRMVAAWLEPYFERSGLRVADIVKRFGFSGGGDCGVTSWWRPDHVSPRVPTWEQWERLKGWLGFGDEMDAEVWRLNGNKGQPGENFKRREKIGERLTGDAVAWYSQTERGDGVVSITAPATPEAKAWDGWGTALKPAWEPIIVARKPLIGTVAENVLRYGTGAINVDGARVGHSEPFKTTTGRKHTSGQLNRATNDGRDMDRWEESHNGTGRELAASAHPAGRWPANLVHDGSDEVTAGFPHIGASFRNGDRGNHTKMPGSVRVGDGKTGLGYSDTGSAARFFYCAKASKADRDEGCEGLEEREAKRTQDGGDDTRGQPTPLNRNHHPTVKPTALMRYLVKLVTRRGGVVLDPFMGSGSTGKACAHEGMEFIGIDLSPEYCEIAARRIAAVVQPALTG